MLPIGYRYLVHERGHGRIHVQYEVDGDTAHTPSLSHMWRIHTSSAACKDWWKMEDGRWKEEGGGLHATLSTRLSH